MPVLWNRKRARSSHSARDCAAKLKMRPERVKDMLLEHGVSPAMRQSAAGRTMLAISSSQLEDIESRIQEWVPYRQAARMYGLSPARQKELIRAGWLQGRGNRIKKASLHKLFEKLNAASISIHEISCRKTLTLSKALQLYIPLPLTDSFLAALVAREVGLYVNREAVIHCNDMQVALDDLLAFEKKDKGKAAAYLSLPDAALHMKLKQEVLYHLVNQGHIKVTIQRMGRRSARFISLEEIQRFSTQNESLADAAARVNVGARAAVRWAHDQGLELFSGPGIDGGRQYFVRRSEFQR